MSISAMAERLNTGAIRMDKVHMAYISWKQAFWFAKIPNEQCNDWLQEAARRWIAYRQELKEYVALLEYQIHERSGEMDRIHNTLERYG